MRARTRLEAARTVETSGQLVRKRFDVDEAVRAGRSDRLFVQTLGVQFPPIQTRDLRAHQSRTALEIVGAVAGPFEKSLVMAGTSASNARRLRSCRIGGGGPGQRAVKVVFRLQELGAGQPQKSFRLGRHGYGEIVLAGVDIRLQLADQPACAARGSGSISSCSANRCSSISSSPKEPNTGVSPLSV